MCASRLQLCTGGGERILQRQLCRCKRHAGADLPLSAPQVPRGGNEAIVGQSASISRINLRSGIDRFIKQEGAQHNHVASGFRQSLGQQCAFAVICSPPGTASVCLAVSPKVVSYAACFACVQYAVSRCVGFLCHFVSQPATQVLALAGERRIGIKQS
jgi:hypothetical protein